MMKSFSSSDQHLPSLVRALPILQESFNVGCVLVRDEKHGAAEVIYLAALHDAGLSVTALQRVIEAYFVLLGKMLCRIRENDVRRIIFVLNTLFFHSFVPDLSVNLLNKEGVFKIFAFSRRERQAQDALAPLARVHYSSLGQPNTNCLSWNPERMTLFAETALQYCRKLDLCPQHQAICLSNQPIGFRRIVGKCHGCGIKQCTHLPQCTDSLFLPLLQVPPLVHSFPCAY